MMPVIQTSYAPHRQVSDSSAGEFSVEIFSIEESEAIQKAGESISVLNKSILSLRMNDYAGKKNQCKVSGSSRGSTNKFI